MLTLQPVDVFLGERQLCGSGGYSEQVFEVLWSPRGRYDFRGHEVLPSEQPDFQLSKVCESSHRPCQPSGRLHAYIWHSLFSQVSGRFNSFATSSAARNTVPHDSLGTTAVTSTSPVDLDCLSNPASIPTDEVKTDSLSNAESDEPFPGFTERMFEL